MVDFWMLAANPFSELANIADAP